MTNEEALAEAQTRWGVAGYIYYDTRRYVHYQVGCQNKSVPIYIGHEDSWEEAFQNIQATGLDG